MSFIEHFIPHNFETKRKNSINLVLNNVGGGLCGNGIDVGCFSATSCGILERRGLNVTYVERDSRCISTIRSKGYNVINTDVFGYLYTVNSLDFITFFGAPCDFSIYSLLSMAESKLSYGGNVIVTGYPNIEGQIDNALTYGGQKFKLSGVHDWDSVGYVYTK